jgi:hypothetical protein
MDPEKRKKEMWISLAMALVVSAVAFCGIFFGRGIYDAVGYSDAFFATAAFEVFFVCLYFIGRTGVFDVAAYGLYRLWESWQPGNQKRWDTAYDYKVYKKDAREENKPLVWPFLAFGGLAFVLALVYLILFHVAG